MTEAPVAVVMPTYRRVTALRGTLARIFECRPAPDQVLVHVDAGDEETPQMLSAEFPTVEVICSETRQGPGGGRNKLMRASRHETVISLDDDSWPLQRDFLKVAAQLLESSEKTAAIACHIVEKDDSSRSRAAGSPKMDLRQTFSFVGCGAIIRRSAFLKTAGYLPLRYAYGMEEADVCLQLLDIGYQIAECSGLSVYHDCPRESHHRNPKINAAQISNTGLFAFLRYPVSRWPYGLLQITNRVKFAVQKRRLPGILTGLASIPISCWRYRKHRKPAKTSTVELLQRLKHQEKN